MRCFDCFNPIKDYPCGNCGCTFENGRFTKVAEATKPQNPAGSAPTPGSVTCCWRAQLYDEQVWDTECGEKWTLTNGTPCDNGMNFCFSCGKRIDE